MMKQIWQATASRGDRTTSHEPTPGGTCGGAPRRFLPPWGYRDSRRCEVWSPRKGEIAVADLKFRLRYRFECRHFLLFFFFPRSTAVLPLALS